MELKTKNKITADGLKPLVEYTKDFMKKLLIGVLALGSVTAYAYDPGFLTRNCVAAYASADQLLTTFEALKEIGIKHTIVKSDAPWEGEFRILAMARNNRLKIDLEEGEVYFNLNKKIRKTLDLKLENGVEFHITARSQCNGSF